MKTAVFLLLVTFNALAFAGDTEAIYRYDKKTYAPSIEACRKLSITADKNECLEQQIATAKPSKKTIVACNKMADLPHQPSNSAYTMALLCQLSNPNPNLNK
ncbi:hypothetical protein R6242_10750 [Iodobacter sp. CM08]|uniref:hypothetical protein n=1 Tax=Iodobacter sp. CM08 TaxID=3085902 RepID=UPI0029818136|nr:hypothetical protein [Iodobacter sp. CM08]MDW5417043.1 hypothetical protein [Iodobacter sp. CM08]